MENRREAYRGQGSGKHGDDRKKDRIIFGIRALQEALDAGKEIEKVLLKSGSGVSDLYRELTRRIHEEKIPFQHVPMEKLNAITRKNHQGVIAYLSEITYSEIDFILPSVFEKGEVPLILMLDQVSDVRNFGAIARTAECAGVHAIVIPFKGGARITAEAVKTSAGALHAIPVCRHPDLTKVLKYLKESGLKACSATEKADKSIYDADLKDPCVIIMGAEDRGISPKLAEEVDLELGIPLHGKISSLNVSVATGIVLFEVLRQRKV